MGRKKKPENEKATKPGVSLDHECRIILSKILEWELAVQNNDMTASQAIRKCMRIAWQNHYEKIFTQYEAQTKIDDLALVNEDQISAQKSSTKASNVTTDVSAKTVKPYKRSAGGSSTATTDRSRRTG
jgi:hypothetical protein